MVFVPYEASIKYEFIIVKYLDFIFRRNLTPDVLEIIEIDHIFSPIE
jgi:hypothetical protein